MSARLHREIALLAVAACDARAFGMLGIAQIFEAAVARREALLAGGKPAD